MSVNVEWNGSTPSVPVSVEYSVGQSSRRVNLGLDEARTLHRLLGELLARHSSSGLSQEEGK